MTKSKVPDAWPYACQVCAGGWCLPAAEMLAEADPHERGGLLAKAFSHAMTPAPTPDERERGTET